MQISIRPEKAGDREAIRNVNFAAFGNRNDEADLIDRIRESESFVPELSLVAVLQQEIVGHVMLSKAAVYNGKTKHTVIALAPLAVQPEYQKQGIGKRLVQEGLKLGKELGFPLGFLIGHPDYYPKLGFKPARSFGYELKQYNVPDEVFMVSELQDGALDSVQGEFMYPNAFFSDTTFAVRPATDEDVPFLWDMLFESLYTPEGGEPFSRDILKEPFLAKYVEGWGRPGDIGYIAVNEKGQSVGSITARLFDAANKGFGYVADDVPELGMAIHREYRGYGLGKRLMNALFHRLKELGVKRVSLSVDPNNTAAVRLYERFGFVEVGVVGTSITMVAPV
ncbi:GNAT family N-acetyltransferase [Paenibacillus nanensis]|uniref:GNAT family N-acetyltransferase n=1 Tax=Paenibacillus nanensis TaxID=393251 RepID=A0A3A1V2W7_9BACL|nr:GNAT family N-acetyltransferase [Paenibacillus nanensis]RIX53702.1 GNAT family N-acetyltransferase [Paenibacillus nanensis]